MISNHRSIAFLIALCSLASTAQAADLAVRSAPSAVAPAPAFDWQRCYLGLHAGYRHGNSDNDYGAVSYDGDANFDAGRSGGLVGAQAGCNLQPNGSLVVGIEGEISVASGRAHTARDNLHLNAPVEYSAADPWSADLALRAGVPIDRALLYVKGGLAFSHFDYSWGRNDFPAMTNHSDRFGGIVGAGLEYAISQNVSLKLEYDHFDYGKAGVTSPTYNRTFHARETNDVVKIGINYLLDGKGPVVAKY